MSSDVFYQAMLARDHRFDGKFFVGVKTTGIYCRPICPARPKRENVEFFTSAPAAERAGYRPCLRCRPESAPLSAAWRGTSAVVNLALKTLATQGLANTSFDQFAERFGLSGRHLRRLFVIELGQSPKQIYAITRLNFARQLIVETRLPMTTVALTSGFNSLRRFNDAFKKRFQRSPQNLRRNQSRSATKSEICLSLAYRPPLAWDALLAHFRNHQIAGIESVEGDTYSRIFALDDVAGRFWVSPSRSKNKIALRVQTQNPAALFSVAQRVRQMFDLDSDPLLVANAFRAHPRLNALHSKTPGLRVARAWDPFESAVCTILGQLVSMQFARTLAGQLVHNYGQTLSDGTRLFPTAEQLAKSDLCKVKTTGNRRRAIRELSRRVACGELDLYTPQDPLDLRQQLLQITGVGQWSAEYIALRALGDPDAFPATDLVLKRALTSGKALNIEEFRPWRSYAAVYLWHEQLNRKGENAKRHAHD
jgi:AraC family transcriptional regulator of adaptative response / DNA-3-methyladenine glycosylase II